MLRVCIQLDNPPMCVWPEKRDLHYEIHTHMMLFFCPVNAVGLRGIRSILSCNHFVFIIPKFMAEAKSYEEGLCKVTHYLYMFNLCVVYYRTHWEEIKIYRGLMIRTMRDYGPLLYQYRNIFSLSQYGVSQTRVAMPCSMGLYCVVDSLRGDCGSIVSGASRFHPVCSVCGVRVHALCNRIMWPNEDVRGLFDEPYVGATLATKKDDDGERIHLCFLCRYIHSSLLSLGHATISPSDETILCVSVSAWKDWVRSFTDSNPFEEAASCVDNARITSRGSHRWLTMSHMWHHHTYRAVNNLIASAEYNSVREVGGGDSSSQATTTVVASVGIVDEHVLRHTPPAWRTRSRLNLQDIEDHMDLFKTYGILPDDGLRSRSKV